MFRGEKNTQWEGGFSVPTMIQWPGVTKPGTVVNEIGAHNVGQTEIKGQLPSASVSTECNRDTLYRTAIVDISEGATLNVPDAGDRYMSATIVN
jgi:hypothetical protein